MWIRGDHDMTLSSTRTSAAREEEERGGSVGDRAGRERKGGRVGSQGWQIDRHAKTTESERQRVRRVGVTSWGQASICACARVEEASTSILPRTTACTHYTLHRQHALGPITWWVSVRGRRFCAGKGLRKYREILYILRRSRGVGNNGSPRNDKSPLLILTLHSIQYV